MALQVWLPLDGSNINQGISSLLSTTKGAVTFNANGKIGYCAEFTGDCSKAIYLNGLKQTTNFSWSCWFNAKSTPGSYNFILSEGRDYENYGFNIVLMGTTLRIMYGANFIKNIMTINLNEWYHIAVTVGTELDKIKIYINGALHDECDYVIPNYVYSQDKFVIGKMAYNYASDGSYFPFDGYINDVRIYDHCLSPKEVKEISKGLVLHYRLSGVGGENKVINSTFITGDYTDWVNWSQISTREVTSNNWLHLKKNASSSLVYGGISQEIGKGCKNSSIIRENVPLTCSCTAYGVGEIVFWCHWRSSSGGANLTQSIGKFTLSSTPKKYTFVFQPYSNDTYNVDKFNLMIGLYSSTSDEVYIKDIKLEEGTIATPWCPNLADTLYSTLGLNNNIEYDCSGYKHNGTKVGTIVCDSDTPRYSTSYRFKGVEYISISNGEYPKPIEELTVSWWGNMSNWNNYQRACSCTEGGGWNFETNSSKMSFPVYQSGVGYIRGIDNTNLSDIPSGWHHWVSTFSKGIIKFYRDGELKNTYTSTSTNGIGYANTPLMVGCESPAGSNYVGNLSDFRIYSTALSDSDIKELYNSGAWVTQNVAAAYELREE